jgi:hypothetical protein
VLLKDEQGRMQFIAAVMRDETARFEEIRALKQKCAEETALPETRGTIVVGLCYTQLSLDPRHVRPLDP